MKPTYEELEKKIEILEAQLKQALDRIAKLEKQLGKNSKNSSKPPSQDQKANTSEDSEKKERESRPGKSRAPYPPERVNEHVECTLTNCPHCNSKQLMSLKEDPVIWQQVELPPIQAIVTQFACQRYQCEECGKRSIGNLPGGVPFSAFGPKLMALIASLTGCFHMAKREAMSLISNLYDINLSRGSITNVEENVAKALNNIYERIHHCVVKGKITRYFDETSWRNSGKRQYAWIATNKVGAYYQLDPRRSQEAFFKIIGNHTKAPSVTDRYSAYNVLDGPHQYCLAHLIREFHAFAEEKSETGRIGKGIEEELRKACSIHAEWRKGIISKKQKALRLAHSKKRLDLLFSDGIASGSDELSNLCIRLGNQYEHLWAFAKTDGMEPTNNMAERDLRKLVLWRKKSYGTRSPRGQRFVERITSVVETLKKHGRNILHFLEEAVKAFYRKQPAPYIFAEMGI